MGDKLKLFDQFESLARFIKEKRACGKIYFMPNPGNWGDGLINYSTYEFFDHFDIDYNILNPKKRKYYYKLKNLTIDSKKDVLIYGGGGGWNSIWNFPLNKLSNDGLLSMFKEIIVLPSSYCNYLKSDKISYFSRDKYNSLKNNSSALYCPDMAFYLGTTDLTNYTKSSSSGTGYFFRTDKESSGKNYIPEENLDISLLGDYLNHYHDFFKLIGQYDTIYTDRLHVCIGGHLLNKNVYFYEGSYFKNEAVYKSTLTKDRRVKFEKSFNYNLYSQSK